MLRLAAILLHLAPVSDDVLMHRLVLKTTRSHYGSPFDSDDYVVLEDGKVIGRIVLQPQAPEGRRWFWTITAVEHPPSIHIRGHAATRDQAMKDFKKQWQS
jgi:hypothetical protein